ncbi:hypothetical protein [Streptomyces poonensis]|uniref:Membrane protein n=1 Tax=Streptomyces poonensis TaxID=68255 RepID=A0A918Q782_9ACTN|nr:hypothetical protein [Streptomyces poonensis]GGZ33019.1 membrane protein [Streptomyces poonensis]GLJ93189.1 membrane protein [Streptomyces poonensis]
MSTTRHHINRQRRRQAREIRPAAASAASAASVSSSSPSSSTPTTGPATEETTDRRASTATVTTTATVTADERTTDSREQPTDAREQPTRARPRRPTALVVLCALTVLLGGFAGWAHAKAQALRDDPARRNTALTDLARTSEIKGQTAKAVDRLFSYDHTDPDALGEAAGELLTGKAVDQHRDLLADVRQRADEQKAVITTTVTESAVERIDGDRARVLVYADQSSVGTAGNQAAPGGSKEATEDEGVYAGAMLAVDVVHRDGRWLVSGIDTFGR